MKNIFRVEEKFTAKITVIYNYAEIYNLEKKNFYQSILKITRIPLARKADVSIGGNILFFLKAARNQFRLITLLGPP